MYLKSLYPWPPPVPDTNVYYCMFGPESDAPIKDYVLHIDALSGKKRMYHEFRERVRDAATALGAPASEGGLGLNGEAGDIVGILSHNAMVSNCGILPCDEKRDELTRCAHGRTISPSCRRS